MPERKLAIAQVRPDEPFYFLRLPLEIQTRICQFALAIHHPISLTRKKPNGILRIMLTKRRGTRPLPVALMKVSRRVNAVACYAFYRYNVFRFHDRNGVNTAQQFWKQIGDNSRNIRHVQFKYAFAWDLVYRTSTVLQIDFHAIKHMDFIIASEALERPWMDTCAKVSEIIQGIASFMFAKQAALPGVSVSIHAVNVREATGETVRNAFSQYQWPGDEQPGVKLVRGECNCQELHCKHTEAWCAHWGLKTSTMPTAKEDNPSSR